MELAFQILAIVIFAPIVLYLLTVSLGLALFAGIRTMGYLYERILHEKL